MSFHFPGGIHGPHSDVGPGDIIVDPFAAVLSGPTQADALLLSSGAWNVTVNGAVQADRHAINLKDAGAWLSNVIIGTGASVKAGG
jgi:hypothetical protein